ncbi:hypothetical protein [Streptomyces roseicoloratus]|uniref:Integral membrane protein n=1 Tax=Streptomyces roseicoloratus TaxID=2508722 RepID=A0ABY9RUQ1_9ACTN|nr:hypothetical protein [Streptomyces roseicoloratus]WMX45454.1 hypothetical protein RGF97_12170 [Streptomyces roseicoloratus]
MAVQVARQCGADAEGGGCPHCGRSGHRRAVAAFLARRDELAAGHGVPAALAHSPVASRQWVSDELAQSARTVTTRDLEAGAARHGRVYRGTLAAVWGGVLALLLGQALTALGGGWTGTRTAGLAAAVLLAGALTAAARLHRDRGGVLAPLLGEDNRLSTSRTVAAGWLLLAVFAVLHLSFLLAGGATSVDLGLRRGAGLLVVLLLVGWSAVTARLIVALRVAARRLQKVRADRPRPADLLCDDDGRADLTDVQYVLVSAAVLVVAAVRLCRAPDRLPELPWALVLLVAVSATCLLAGKSVQGGRPKIFSVVRAREAGDLDAPIRTGDDIEIRGSGFVPPGAAAPEPLTRLVVRIGPVHAHVPLVPVPGGFANPTDTTLTVPLPADVEPGRVDVSVVTAAGVETNRVTIDVLD